MMGSGRVGWLVLVGLTSPHSWQAQSSHLWRPTSVILTVRPPLNWTLAALQAKIQHSLRLRCFWHSGVDSSGRNGSKLTLTINVLHKKLKHPCLQSPPFPVLLPANVIPSSLCSALFALFHFMRSTHSTPFDYHHISALILFPSCGS